MRSFGVIPHLAVGMSVLLSPETSAEPQRFAMDTSHSRIVFSISHFGFSMLPGIFREFDAELLYDHETPAESRLSVTIQAASVDMFHERLNNHLKADDFFAVEKYPTLTFVSTQVEPLSDDKASVTGDFTMLGKTLPMTLDVLLIKYAPHPMSGKQPVGFEATGTIDRTEFGMTYRAPFVGEEVRFTITMEAHAQ